MENVLTLTAWQSQIVVSFPGVSEALFTAEAQRDPQAQEGLPVWALRKDICLPEQTGSSPAAPHGCPPGLLLPAVWVPFSPSCPGTGTGTQAAPRGRLPTLFSLWKRLHWPCHPPQAHACSRPGEAIRMQSAGLWLEVQDWSHAEGTCPCPHDSRGVRVPRLWLPLPQETPPPEAPGENARGSKKGHTPAGLGREEPTAGRWEHWDPGCRERHSGGSAHTDGGEWGNRSPCFGPACQKRACIAEDVHRQFGSADYTHWRPSVVRA